MTATRTAEVVTVLLWRHGAAPAAIALDAVQGALADQDTRVWVDIQGPLDATLLSRLQQAFGLTALALDRLQETRTRAKLTADGHYFYLAVHGLAFDTMTLQAHTPKLDIFFGMNFLLTVHPEPFTWLQDMLDGQGISEADTGLPNQGTAQLLYLLLDSLVDSYFPVLDDLDDLVDQLEDATVTRATDQVQGRIFAVKRSLAQMRRVISPQVEVTNSLITRTGEFIPSDVEPYFADVHDHLVRAFEVLDSYRDLMSGLLDVYLTTVSNRLNVVMKQLTIIATIFMPITFVTGVFGQNFGLSPQVTHDSGYNFYLVLLLMAIITVSQVIWFRRRGWL